MRVSLIVTIKNEAESIRRLLDSVAAQSCAPDEIVIVDGGSTDGTLETLRKNPWGLSLRVIESPGANISQGRNAAIGAATGTVICSTDAGVWLEPDWVKTLIAPLAGRSSSADVVSGFFVPDPHGAFETALAATTLPALADIHPEKFQPSSRSIAFRKAAWEKVQGYPEWLDYCEDLLFDFALRDAGYRFAFAPGAVAHFRPRANLRAFFKQYYRYARGDGKANLFFKRHLIRYATYWIALPLVVLLTIFAPLVSLPLWALAAVFMFFTPYKRLMPMLRALNWIERLSAIGWVPVIRVTGDMAKMIGYPVGVVWRTKHRKE
ncbi:MAG: glycosyltransferase [Chloroflexi bacterium]|nr:glycosyltransferase [Chloroflexota bacterium]